MPQRDPSSGIGRRGFLQASAASLVLANRIGRIAGAEPDAIVPPIDERLRALSSDPPLAMQFRGHSADEARQWQVDFGAKLRAMLGPFQPPAKWECTLERRVELPGHVREERVLAAAGVAPVPFHLLLPKSKDGRRPAMLAVHGHGPFAHDVVAGIDDTPERQANLQQFQWDYGRKLAERGYVVAAPCLTPFGRRLGTKAEKKRSDPCTDAYLHLLYFGKLLISENLRDILWTLEFLARHDAVDPARIGCAGLSYGGRMTMLAAAVEPRIRVAVIAGALNAFQERSLHQSVGGCQMIPGLLELGDVPEIASLIAPRTCLWEIGSRDPHVPAEWVDRLLARQQKIYDALGASDRLQVDRFDGAHEWHGEVAYRVLENVLGS